jgi:hypothetical protein
MSAVVTQYLVNVANAVTGNTKEKEKFTAENAGTGIMFSAFFTLFILFMISFGAARLSYCYNVYTGNSGSALAWSVLAFFFSSIYYPFYALFLNPLCSVAPLTGGRRRY